MTDPLIAQLEQERDYWQEAHRRRCRELLQARAELARFAIAQPNSKEVVVTVGYTVE